MSAILLAISSIRPLMCPICQTFFHIYLTKYLKHFLVANNRKIYHDIVSFNIRANKFLRDLNQNLDFIRLSEEIDYQCFSNNCSCLIYHTHNFHICSKGGIAKSIFWQKYNVLLQFGKGSDQFFQFDHQSSNCSIKKVPFWQDFYACENIYIFPKSTSNLGQNNILLVISLTKCC